MQTYGSLGAVEFHVFFYLKTFTVSTPFCRSLAGTRQSAGTTRGIVVSLAVDDDCIWQRFFASFSRYGALDINFIAGLFDAKNKAGDRGGMPSLAALSSVRDH
jgi:hypothetical protein